METNELKKLIGTDCLVIDPRSKKRGFEPATIKAVSYLINKHGENFYEYIRYDVVLHRLSIRKGSWNNGEYHKSFTVGGDRIKFNQ